MSGGGDPSKCGQCIDNLAWRSKRADRLAKRPDMIPFCESEGLKWLPTSNPQLSDELVLWQVRYVLLKLMIACVCSTAWSRRLARAR
ncbi:hypothetical protein L226DRAFT_538401 [Lentinus tigrinus ALCF2SS1-7]|uniref:Uncharacterized protein n=1 Tax=Lentinus tigrinus ALCF2SS1-6 TaxID=1328759 RepID=A0A5C2RYZ6_9APHY|nr:hypothetical protein L227DRAFT_578980 [Lentinus tigrinus ALCF2SS1-6]RPD71025.1 hypothetical protein L226DRAFT_538401 [Lentinus tigrinus ALCF2SS1-7]